MKHWTKKEKEFLKNAIEGGAQHLDVAQALGRTETAITQKVRKMRAYGEIEPKPMPRWDDDENSILAASWNSPKISRYKIHQHLPRRTKAAVLCHGYRLAREGKIPSGSSDSDHQDQERVEM